MRWSKKFEMDTAERPQRTVLMENMEVNSNVGKISPHSTSDKGESVLKGQDSDLVDQKTEDIVMNPQYLELERTEPGSHPTGTQVVKVSANGQLVSCEMLQHVGTIDGDQHPGLLLHVLPPSHSDLKEATTYYAPAQQLQRAGTLLTEERYLTEQLATHYEDDLLAHDLTEDDRRLAAALMAVQYSQQQKQQHLSKLLEPGTIVPSEANVIMSVSEGMQGLIAANQLGKVVTDASQGSMSDMVVEYIQQVEGTSHPLDPSRKPMRLITYQTDPQALHNAESAHLQTIEDSQLHLKTITQAPPILKKALSSPMSPRARYKRSTEVGIGVVSTVGLQDMSGAVGESVIRDTHGTMLKTEEEEPEFDTDEDFDDSDYDAESEARSSRRSLPHKKRIPRKLKNPKKSPGQDKNFKCNKCPETFQSQTAFFSHRETHMKSLYRCEICKKNSANQLKFFEHLKSHYEPTKNTQSENENEILHNETLKEEQHTSVIVQDLPPALPPPLTCQHCGKIFRRQKALEKHISMTHEQVEEELEEMEEGDEYGIVDESELIPEDIEEDEEALKKGEWITHHELTAVEAVPVEGQIEGEDQKPEDQDGQPVFTEISVADLPPCVEEYNPNHLCDHCGESFELKSQLTLHMRDEHPEIKRKPRKKEIIEGEAAATVTGDRTSRKWEQLTCPTCGRMFNHRNSLVYHLRSHTGERPHQCEVCGKSFFAASALKVHMRLHSGDKPYKCELCGRHFRQWGDLKYHCISIHTDEKQYQCEYCGKDFARKYSLIVHRRIHTGEKNYKCEFCNKTFRASSYLQNHRRIHTGEKPHPCDVCGKPFRVRSDMKRHMQTHSRDVQSHNSSSSMNAAAIHVAALSQSSQSNSSQGANEVHTTPHNDLTDLDPVATEITIQDGENMTIVFEVLEVNDQ